MKLVLLGPPGSGKGTQAKEVVERLGLIHLSTGNMLREAVASKTAVGLGVEAIMARGGLAPDNTVVDIVAERIGEIGPTQGFILDGFPRTMDQAIGLDLVLDRRDQRLDRVVELQAATSDLLDRIERRARDARARGEPERTDDNRETFERRIAAYQTETTPLLRYYHDKGILVSVDGMRDAHTVSQSIRAALGA